MRAKDIMTVPVVTVSPKASVGDAAALMVRHDVSCLVVVDRGGEIVGILTHSDFALHRKFMPLGDNLYRILGTWADPGSLEQVTHSVRNRALGDVMARDVVVVTEDADVSEVVDTMLRRRVNRLPVVRGKELVGIITRHDLLKIMVDEVQGSIEAVARGPSTVEGIAGVILWTDNVERLAQFYRDVVGLTVHSERPHFVAFTSGDVRLSVGLHDGVSGASSDPYRVMVNLAVTDIHRVHSRLAAQGVEFLREPEEEHWGGLVATFRDPDGNLLQLLQQPS